MDAMISAVIAVLFALTAVLHPPALAPTDLGSGRPGAFCASSRLGKQFVKGGVTYTCKGPKPYRWRRA